MSRFSIITVAIASLSLGLATTDADAKSKVRKACKAEVEKFCADIQKGHGRTKDCLKPHMSELSAPCSDAIKASDEAKAKK